ncbi:glycosyl hydrolase 53 family protein [Hymenobacter sp. ASUV-10]|uniref:Arabinogalactan endo-beta-1,4-galactanase n=1 Tax=Hymenobacter aranciens TaxID=3063996 RepID=A0ABT9BD49_9BACT|nr:glycosyl hydrolase 53 family protein [Hymenobacter sp. ASUV-10]MDO7874962.1 glycosyl hydrolase 53 family protein [Hymenobacter sp. ASUV-10]
MKKLSRSGALRTLILLGVIWSMGILLPAAAAAQAFAKGADVGWLQQMEATGYVFYNEQGVAQDCFQILKSKGINSIRLRVFVNPSDDKASGHCSPAEVVTMAKRASALGFRIMIDFHYSDTWADPAKQAKPAAWASHPFGQLLTDVYDHTASTMRALQASGVTPEWVQIGNEIPGGMLWPDGSTDNFVQLSQLLNKGYDAVKAVSPTSKVIVHLDRGNKGELYRWFFDQHQANGGRYDVIGMSYYPYWLKENYKLSIKDLQANLLDMASRYGKAVMITEVGGEDTAVQDTYDMLLAVQQAVRAVPRHQGLGVFYWEPEGAKSWSGYALSAWGADGKPTAALNAFRDQPRAKPAPAPKKRASK